MLTFHSATVHVSPVTVLKSLTLPTGLLNHRPQAIPKLRKEAAGAPVAEAEAVTDQRAERREQGCHGRAADGAGFGAEVRDHAVHGLYHLVDQGCKKIANHCFRNLTSLKGFALRSHIWKDCYFR